AAANTRFAHARTGPRRNVGAAPRPRGRGRLHAARSRAPLPQSGARAGGLTPAPRAAVRMARRRVAADVPASGGRPARIPHRRRRDVRSRPGNALRVGGPFGDKPVDRDETYSASALYAGALVRELLPEIAKRAPHGTRIGMGASLGALAMLHTHIRHPKTFDGLLLQSGSFFRQRYDKHEINFPRY